MTSPSISPYESRRWRELNAHWTKKAKRRELVPPKARAALGAAGEKTKELAVRAGTAVAEATPESLKDFGTKAASAALVSAVDGIVRTVELVSDFVVELTDPQNVIDFHRRKGRDVASLADLRELDLADLDEVVRRLVLQWRSFGAAEGAALGALAMVPFAGGALAIGADLLVMQILANAIATRVCYAYGFDAKDPAIQYVVRRMATRSFGEQVPKAATARSANLAAVAAKGRKNWSKKLRDDHRILAALEKLMKQWNSVPHVPVGKVAKGLPFVAVVTSTGTNAYVIGDVAKQARLYAQTLFLAEKYDLALPPNLTRLADLDDEPRDDEGEVSLGITRQL
ncbi:EcsC family protein [Streptomyces sp. GMY01]|uniref:EcsC family protein n=1 Tax=Streptomyces sp. GMY02 TaxID=1333528 RepID=UPI00146D0AFA|nr:EcsC family protein [Streptomyces sp. GMY02]NMO35424.1 EcsC family protein [Streptomyces sp. GMY02]